MIGPARRFFFCPCAGAHSSIPREFWKLNEVAKIGSCRVWADVVGAATRRRAICTSHARRPIPMFMLSGCGVCVVRQLVGSSAKQLLASCRPDRAAGRKKPGRRVRAASQFWKNMPAGLFEPIAGQIIFGGFAEKRWAKHGDTITRIDRVVRTTETLCRSCAPTSPSL